MLEIVVSILLLTVGALGYAAVTARLARAFFLNAQRARSGEVISSRRETLVRDGCQAAAGSDNRFNLAFQWSVDHSAAGHSAVITSKRTAAGHPAYDTLRGAIPCI